MKKHIKIIFTAVTAVILALCLSACGKPSQDSQSGDNGTASSDTLPSVVDTAEYVLYQNIFYNDQGGDYDGSSVTKKGTFTTISDRYNDTMRYYVWGYNDNTKCCDWQWELKVTDTQSLPSDGSLIEVTGDFVSNEDALDGYWIENPQITVLTQYNGPDCDVDMTSMDGTLERVQLMNMQQFPDDFEGKTVNMYGRVSSPTSIQHPYYDSVWTQEFSSDDTTPATGTVVVVSGTYKDGVITGSSVSKTDMF